MRVMSLKVKEGISVLVMVKKVMEVRKGFMVKIFLHTIEVSHSYWLLEASIFHCGLDGFTKEVAMENAVSA